MAQSTLTDKGQTTVPLEVRAALNVKPRQQLEWIVLANGTAVVRPQTKCGRSFWELKTSETVSRPQGRKGSS